MGIPGPHNSSDMGTEGPESSSVIGTGGHETLVIWGSFSDIGTPTLSAMNLLSAMP